MKKRNLLVAALMVADTVPAQAKNEPIQDKTTQARLDQMVIEGVIDRAIHGFMGTLGGGCIAKSVTLSVNSIINGVDLSLSAMVVLPLVGSTLLAQSCYKLGQHKNLPSVPNVIRATARYIKR